MAFEFDRYINGQLMAEGVTIERQGNLPDAMREAARIASRGPNGEVPVLVLRAEALSRTGAVKVSREEAEKLCARLEYDASWDKCGSGYYSMKRQLSALEPAAQEGFCYRDENGQVQFQQTAPEGRQEAVAWQHIPNCGVDRESKMVHVTGKVFCDPCIAPLVAALNAASIETVASCCGHGHRPGVIVLRDGRELFIAKDFEEARKVDAAFPTDINGDDRPAEQAVTEAMVEAVVKAIRPYTRGTLFLDEHQILVRAALKAAMEAGR